MSQYNSNTTAALQQDLFTTRKHYDALHAKAEGVSLIWQKQVGSGSWKKCNPGDELGGFLQGLKGSPDTYLSVSEFYGWRLIRLLKSLRAIYVDIDNPALTISEVLEYTDDLQLPRPSIVLHSGRGIHLYYLLEPTHGKALPLWQRVQNKLVESFKEIGSDRVAKDCTRMLRLVGTVNSKTGTIVEGFILDNYRWPLHDLADELLGHRIAEPVKTAQRRTGSAVIRDIRPKQRQVTGSIYARWHLVYWDLIKIAEYHGRIPDGFRNNWLFLSAVSLSWFTHAAGLEGEIRANLNKWTTLDEQQGMSAMQSIIGRAQDASGGVKLEYQGKQVDSRYRFKRSTLLEWCGDYIPNELQESMRAIVSDDVAAKRKKIRDDARWNNRRGIKRRHGMDMILQGKSPAEVAKLLGVGVSTAYKWKSILKQQFI